MAEQVSKFSCAPIVHHGPGALGELAGEIAKLGGQRVALVTDPGLIRAGLVDRVRQAAGVDLHLFSEVEPEPPYELVHRCVDFLRAHECDLVIGLGGGSAIDVAKMAAVMMANPGRVPDYWGVGLVRRRGLPVIGIPTTAGTSAEISAAAVFVDPEAQSKKGIRSDFILCQTAIMDPTLTIGLPRDLTAYTGMDALTHAIEAYTSPRATLVTAGNAEQSVALIGAHLRQAYANGESLAARSGMMAGCLFAGLALNEVNVGAVHGLSQTLGGRFHVGHGLANALFLPYVMAFNRIACREQYARVAMLLGEKIEGLSLDEASRRGVEAVRRLSLDLGVP
ncbi:MAG TPA: iron-containing alcohol dehydrogenase, partial [Chloroflexi bacterium]|nr:iron-containing alcohol dehydrogenase [Chloroflexota bacterium]